MGLTGCNDEAFDIDSVNKQTLLIMYPWSGTENSAGLYSDMVNNLNQIENAIKKNKGLKSTRVFVFMSTSATESSLFELTYNSSTFTVEHQMLENYTGTAYTTTEGLTDIIGEVKQHGTTFPTGPTIPTRPREKLHSRPALLADSTTRMPSTYHRWHKPSRPTASRCSTSSSMPAI